MDKIIRKAVRCYLIKDNNVVVIKYKKGNKKEGYYDIPGGKIENMELPEQTVIREMKEETGLAEILAKPLASIFVSYDKELLELTINALRLYSLSYIISWFNVFASSFFTALNNGVVSALISFLRTLLFQVVMILILPAILGINGIWISVACAEILAVIISIICIVKNRKKYGYA